VDPGLKVSCYGSNKKLTQRNLKPWFASFAFEPPSIVFHAIHKRYSHHIKFFQIEMATISQI